MIESLSPVNQMLDFAASHDILVGARMIQVDDEFNLLPEEAVFFGNAIPKVRRQSGAVRTVARQLLSQLGVRPCAIGKGQSGAPIWPAGIVGSMAHDDYVAISAIARDRGGSSIGIDFERQEPMPAEIAQMVATPAERRRYPPSILLSRQLFVIKEAVYKATFPIDGKFLEFHDVDVDLVNASATTRYGISVNIFLSCGFYISALAVMGL